MSRTVIALALGLAVAGTASAGDDDGIRYEAELVGFNAGGAPIATNATGEARVDVIDDGTALNFRVKVEGINNLIMAHIHIAPAPVALTDPAGPIAYWFTGGPPPGANLTVEVDGRLSEGYIITDGDVDTWDATEADAGTVAGLIRAIDEGRASVVIHTDDLDPNTPTGVEGDSRAGELRGTLLPDD